MKNEPDVLTQHAKARSQQRGIPTIVIDLLLDFGTTTRAPGGAEKIYFDKSSRKRLRAYVGPLASLLDRHLNIYAVVNKEDRVITTGFRHRRVKHR